MSGLTRDSWPSLDLFREFLQQIEGVTIPSDDLLSIYLNGAIVEFGNDTSWNPFLADTVASTKIFDAPLALEGKYILYMDNGVNTSSLLVYTNYSPTYAGDLQTVNVDYYVRDRNIIEFKTVIIPTVNDQSIKIVTNWGYDTELPTDVYNGVLSRAVSSFLKKSNSLPGRIVETNEDTVKYKFSQYKTLTDTLDEEYENTVSNYIRLA